MARAGRPLVTSDRLEGVHVVGAVTGILLSIGLPAFWTDPLGDVALAEKLVTNTVLLGLVVAVAGIALRRERYGLDVSGQA